MDLITKLQAKQLRANGIESSRAIAGGTEPPDHWPVVKLFNAYGDGIWLLAEQNAANPDDYYGIADMGHGTVEHTTVALSDLQALTYRGTAVIQADLEFIPDRPLCAYFEAASKIGEL